MSDLIPRLKLFPLYPGGRTLEAGGLNSSSAFSIPATRFTPSYDVNSVSSGALSAANESYNVGPDYRLRSVSVSESSKFNRALGISANPGDRLAPRLEVTSAPATAPQSPDKYREYISTLDISDRRFDDLMAEPSFRLPQIGIGLKVTTNGLGQVDNVSVSPSQQRARTPLNTLDTAFSLPKRAQITEGAIFKVDPSDGSPKNQTPLPVARKPVRKPSLNLQNNVPNLRPQGEVRLNAPLEALRPGDLDLKGLEKFGKLESNPALEQFLGFPPRSEGLAVAGPQSDVDLTRAKQIAANRAKLDLTRSEAFAQNLKDIQTTLIRQGEVYSPFRLVRALDGRMPVAPSLPPVPSQGDTMSAGRALGMLEDAALSYSGVDDASSRRSAGGYVPFRMSSGSEEMGGGQSFGGHGGGHMSGGGQERQQRRRQPFSMTA